MGKGYEFRLREEETPKSQQMERRSILLVNRKVQMEATQRYHFPSIRLADIRKTVATVAGENTGREVPNLLPVCEALIVNVYSCFLEIERNTGLLTWRSHLWNFIPEKCKEPVHKGICTKYGDIVFSGGNRAAGNNPSPHQSGTGWRYWDSFIHPMELCVLSLHGIMRDISWLGLISTTCD